jgi:peptidoglycan-associated lipoprotein
MRQLLSILGVTLLITGCGSAVKLDSVPVEDKAGIAVSKQDTDGQINMVAKTGVASVDIGKSTQSSSITSTPRIVYFEYDSIVIQPAFQSVIEAHSRLIKADKSHKVAIEGHTDERGGREYNLSLGQKRAEAVRNALNLLGVADSQMEAVSFGKEKPAVQGTDESAMAKNRRAEITYR